MNLVRPLVLKTLLHNVCIRSIHIEGRINEIADSLSRFQWTRFWNLVPNADKHPACIPPEFWEIFSQLSNTWFDLRLHRILKRSYVNAMTLFSKYQNQFGLSGAWPPTLEHLINFIAYMYTNSYSVSTARSYLADLSFYIKLQNHTDITENFIIKKMLEGYKRCRPSKDIRSPITLDMLSNILRALKSLCYSKYQCWLFSCSYLLAFFCWLRVSELAAPNKENTDRVLNLQDIKLTESDQHVTVRFSKIDQYGRGTTLHVSKSSRTSPPLLHYYHYTWNIDLLLEVANYYVILTAHPLQYINSQLC